MPVYEEGTTPASELDRLREAFASEAAAIWSEPDVKTAWDAATALIEAAGRMEDEASQLRANLAAYWLSYYRVSRLALARRAGITPGRMSQVLKKAEGEGNPVSEATTRPIKPALILAIITSDLGVVIAKRHDGRPPWTFPGGDVEYGESMHDAASRRVLAETGLTVTETEFIGSRIHPMTYRATYYVHAKVDGRSPVNGDPNDLEEVRWASFAETLDKMPDVYPPVGQYLEQLRHLQDA